MKICFISREYVGSKRAGGIATYVHEMSRILHEKGHDVFIISASDNTFRSDRKVIDGITYIFLSGADFCIHPIRFFQLIGTKLREYLFYNSYRKKIVKTLKELHLQEGLDIVEFPEFGNEAKYWLKNERRSISTVVRFHGPSGLNISSLEINTKNKRAYQEFITAFKADGISFCSNAMRELLLLNSVTNRLLQDYSGIQKVIYNPIKIHQDSEISGESENYIFSAGTFVVTKGFKELIESVKELKIHPNMPNLIIAGKLGNLGKKYERKCQAKKSQFHWLTILGAIKRDDLYTYYSKAKLCCFPSYWDNMPLTCIEAMSVGGLVLGSRSGGMREIIEDGVDGFLIEPKDVNTLKVKIKEILEMDKEHLLVIRRNAKEKIKNNFSDKVISNDMISFYESLLNQDRVDK